MNLLQSIRDAQKPLLAVLIDPGKTKAAEWEKVIQNEYSPDYYFVGGSEAGSEECHACVCFLKEHQSRPVILFPGNEHQICELADGILLLSLISGRNADLLIGQHVRAAERLNQSSLEIIPTAYVLIDNGFGSSVQRVSQTEPIPAEDIRLCVRTALAGQQLGLQLLYLEAGSGAPRPVPAKLIAEVKKYLRIPLIVGGGIDSVEKCKEAIEAGAGLIVIGNALEKNPKMLDDIAPLFENETARKEGNLLL